MVCTCPGGEIWLRPSSELSISVLEVAQLVRVLGSEQHMCWPLRVEAINLSAQGALSYVSAQLTGERKGTLSKYIK